MSELFAVDGNTIEEDALRAAVKDYKEAMRRFDQDLDVSYLLKTLNSVNERSVVKIARNPLDKNREWVKGTVLHNVGRIDVDDEYHLTLRIRHDNAECTVEKMLDQIEKLKKKMHGTMGPVMLELNDQVKVKLTDVYSHAFVKDVYAGLPADVVLGYFEDGSEK